MTAAGHHAPPWAPGYAHLTRGVPPVSCSFRPSPDDFEVEELPLFEPCGAGTHVLFEAEKRGLSTPEAVRRIASALGVPVHSIGVAGRKDARARTRQWLSVEHIEPERLLALQLPGLAVRRAARHAHKLRLGQLAGNHFRLRLHGVSVPARRHVEEVLERIAASGLPNYFGPQRFGRSGFGHRLGLGLVRGDAGRYLDELTGPDHNEPCEALEHLRATIAGGTRGDFRRLARLIRALEPDLAAVARQLARRPGDLERAVGAVPRRTRQFQLSALQSFVFNHVLSARLAAGTLTTLLPGDLAFLHEGGACFAVALELADAERADLVARVARLELSPSGPLPGPRMSQPSGEPLAAERGACEAAGFAPEVLSTLPAAVRPRGARRPLRVPVRSLSTEPQEDALWLSFELPPGSFATTLVEELRKEHAPGVD